MLEPFLQKFADSVQTLQLLLLFINALVHLFFAGAVAKDAGSLYRLNKRPLLVSGYIWAFATLIGGVITAAIYWFIHHSTLTRPSITSGERKDMPR